MKLSSRRRAIAVTAGLALVAGASPAYGVIPDDGSLNDIVTSLVPNEDNVIPNTTDLYLGTHYSVTMKDDGKLLYRWGQAVKRPTDIRFVAHLPLPDAWKGAEAAAVNAGKGFQVTKAELRVKHSITNNPNDQIRPEDWENEGAIGLQPEYKEVVVAATADVPEHKQWLSTRDCYEGDGDFIPAGTVYRDTSKAFDGALSADLAGGYGNAWYTTIDRDPFAWAYNLAAPDAPQQLVGFPTPQDPAPGTLVSGPRWRLLNTKFGQNIPHTDMPTPLSDNTPACIPPPYSKDLIKYETGDLRVDTVVDPVTGVETSVDVPTTINLLDWKKTEDRWAGVEAYSPFAYTAGWTTTWSGEDTVAGQIVHPVDSEDPDTDAGRCLSKAADGSCVTSLGTKLTEDFDVSFYVKGDMKPVRMYWVELYVEYLDANGQIATLEYDPADEALKGLRHQFTTDDIIADAQGTTDADDINVIKDGDPGETVTGTTMEGKLESGQGTGTVMATLYPIDSEFTFNIQDFVGSSQRSVDGVAEEGWAANYPAAPDPVEALLLVDYETLLMSTVNLVGTWGAGLGGATVKTSSEMFTAMEHVLSCYQTVPYDFWKSKDEYDANPELSVPDAWALLEGVCEATRLPNPFDEDAYLSPPGPLPVLGTAAPNNGVLMPAAMVQGNTYNIPVAVNGIGTLTAFFDWNDNGVFTDAKEALAPIANAQGMWQVQVTVPVDAKVGVISTKFVIANADGDVGEVETYDATITAPATTPVPAPAPAATTPAPAPAATTPAPAPAATTPAPAATTPVVPTAVITVKGVSKNTKLFVDVDPNKGTGYWNIKVYRKIVKGDAVSWKKVGKTLRTKTSKETRTIKLKKGTYRVQVMAKYKMQGAVSSEVTLGKVKQPAAQPAPVAQPAPANTTPTPTLDDVLKMFPGIG